VRDAREFPCPCPCVPRRNGRRGRRGARPLRPQALRWRNGSKAQGIALAKRNGARLKAQGNGAQGPERGRLSDCRGRARAGSLASRLALRPVAVLAQAGAMAQAQEAGAMGRSR
jgi:hypothetical protein